ncbi:hypothetical protein SAMN05216532_0518 [Streptomyces sp. 2231.1]|nr:hypothetical protein SAMN05216532_0518 [Streptomyces sp. 2231.1]
MHPCRWPSGQTEAPPARHGFYHAPGAHGRCAESLTCEFPSCASAAPLPGRPPSPAARLFPGPRRDAWPSPRHRPRNTATGLRPGSRCGTRSSHAHPGPRSFARPSKRSSHRGAAGPSRKSPRWSRGDFPAARIASAGWTKWMPVSAAAIGAHLYGGGLLAVNAHRLAKQKGVAASSAAKTVVTAAALAATAYARRRSTSPPPSTPTTSRRRPSTPAPQSPAPPRLRAMGGARSHRMPPLQQLHGMWGHARSTAPLIH